MKPKMLIQAQVETDLVMMLDAVAGNNERSRSKEITFAIRQYLKNAASEAGVFDKQVTCHQSIAEVACHPAVN